MRVLLLVLALAAIAYSQTDEFERMKKSTLKLVVQVYRHGARYAIYSDVPKSILSDVPKELYHELTPVGIRQQYELGRKLREEYIVKRKFLSEQYKPSEIFVRSTDVPRTLMSAQSQLAGLYPYQQGPKIFDPIKTASPEKKKEILDAPYQFFDNTINMPMTDDEFAIPHGFQPIPIHTVEQTKDKLLLGMSYGCPNSRTWIAENQKSEVWNRISQELAESITKFAKILKIDKNDTFGLLQLQRSMDTIVTSYFQGKDIPTEMLDKDFWTKIEELLILEIHLELFQTQKQKKVSITPFFNSLVGYMDKKLNNTSTYKWYMHSAHDTTVSMLLVGMNLTNWECMERYHTNKLGKDEICLYKPTTYATNLMYELREDADTKEQFVMFSINGEYQPICDQKSKYCSYKEFKSRLEFQAVPDFDEQCGFTQKKTEETPKKTEESASFSSNLGFISITLLTLLLI